MNPLKKKKTLITIISEKNWKPHLITAKKTIDTASVSLRI